MIEKIAEWHASQQHAKIREAILALSENERSDELVCLLARALLNEDDFIGALSALDSIHDNYSDNPYYCVRRGLALFPLHREHEALPWFQKALDLGLEEINEIPGTYFPKSVAEWVRRAEILGPQRIKKNAYEEMRRANRDKTPQSAGFTDAELEGLWSNSPYAVEKYVGKAPTDEDFALIETDLGYRLPASYKALMRVQNGGMLARNEYKGPMLSDMSRDMFDAESIYGIDRDKPYSLCGSTGSKFWIEEWGYPNVGISICGTMSGGHDMIFLDYSDCGPQGEPCVVHIDQESDYEVTYLADNFEAFVRGLRAFEGED